MKFLQKLLQRGKKYIPHVLVLFVCVMLLGDVVIAQATNHTANPGANASTIGSSGSFTKEVNDMLTMMVQVLIMILKVLYAVLIPILGLIGKFLSNDWVTGAAFNVDIIIEMLWQIVRNVVNIAIVFYLLYIAGLNILPFGDNAKGDMKKALPLVVIALIAVNFSLFATRFILNMANVATTIAFSIPSQVSGSLLGNINDATKQPSYHMFVWSTPVTKDFQNALACDTYYQKVTWGELTPAQQQIAKTAAGGKEVKEMCMLNSTCITGNSSGNTVDLNSSCTIKDKDNKKLTKVEQFKSVLSRDYGKGGIGQNVRQVECLHRNYAFNFNEEFVARNGSSLIANPVYDPDTKGYTTGAGHYKRFLVTDSPEIDGKPNPVYDEQMRNRAAWIQQTKRQYTAGMQVGTPDASAQFLPYYSDCILSLDELVFSARNVMFVYAFNLMKVAEYEQGTVNVKAVPAVMMRIAITLIYLGFFILVNIMLLIAVVGRAFYIWAMMILSPVWVITELLKLKISNKDVAAAVGGTTRFIKLAFMPALVGMILSLGFVMFHYLQYIGHIDGLYAGRLQLGGITLYFDPNGVVVSGLGSLFQLMFAMIAIGAVFMAVYEAIKFGFGDSNPFMKGIDAVKKFGGDAVKFAAKAPLSSNIIPLPGGAGKTSLNVLKDMPRQVMDMRTYAKENEGRQNMNKFLADKFNIGVTNISQAEQQKIASAVQAASQQGTTKASSEVARVLESWSQNKTAKDVRLMQAEIMKQLVRSDGTLNTGVSSLSAKLGDQDVKISGGLLEHLKEAVSRNSSNQELKTFANEIHSARDLSSMVTSGRSFDAIQNMIFTPGVAIKPTLSTNTAGEYLVANIPGQSGVVNVGKTPEDAQKVLTGLKNIDTSIINDIIQQMASDKNKVNKSNTTS